MAKGGSFDDAVVALISSVQVISPVVVPLGRDVHRLRLIGSAAAGSLSGTGGLPSVSQAPSDQVLGTGP
jgi:hypothetical protein